MKALAKKCVDDHETKDEPKTHHGTMGHTIASHSKVVRHEISTWNVLLCVAKKHLLDGSLA